MNAQPKQTDPVRWFIVKTRPASETRAGEELLRLGLTVFLPHYRKEYQHHRSHKWTVKHYPLMTGYMFVMKSPHWPRALACDAVEGVLRTQLPSGGIGDPILLDDATVNAIRAAQEAGQYDEMRVHGRNVAVGEIIKVNDGALAGLKGAVAGVGEKEITFMLNMLGREVKTRAPVEILGRTV